MNPVPASRLVAAVVVCSVSVLASCAGDVFRGAPGAGGTSVGAAGFGGVGSAGGAASAGGAGSTGGAGATGHGGATTATSTGGAGGVVTSSGGAGQGGCGGAPAITCHRDADHDGFGDPGVTSPAVCGACPEGFVADDADCNDDPAFGAAYHPGQTECLAHDPGGGWDFDCDGETHPAVSGCPACAHASPNERWCSADCSLRVWKLDAIFVACGEPGLVPRFAQTCGVGPGCDYGGGQALTNDVGSDADACVQSCR